jgi:sorbitol-specific phosphotransferase system component IIA
MVLFVKTQPVLGLHVSVVHKLLSLHTTAAPGWQLPPPQVSPAVQALPSSHAMVLFVKTQPVLGLHVSVVHRLLSLHTTAAPGWQLPPPQVSPAVQALPSSQAVVLFVKTQPDPGSHESVVHPLLSLHTTGAPG